VNRLRRQLADLEARLPVVPDDPHPESWEPSSEFVAWALKCPNGEELVRLFSEDMNRRHEDCLPGQFNPPTKQDLPFIKLLLDALCYSDSRPELREMAGAWIDGTRATKIERRNGKAT
jgi:hypothetical protein